MSAATLIERRNRKLARHLSGKTLRFAAAENCTGGQLAAVLAADAPLGSRLERGFVAYSINAKCEMLVVKASKIACGRLLHHNSYYV